MTQRYLSDLSHTSRVISTNSTVTFDSSRNVSGQSTITTFTTIATTPDDELRQQTYEALLKLVLIEYVNEPRFRIPIVKPPPATSIPKSSPSNSSSSTSSKPRKNRFSYHSLLNDDEDPKIPQDVMKTLVSHIAQAATSNQISDPFTKRCALALYAKLPSSSNNLLDVGTLIGQFVTVCKREIELTQQTTDAQVISTLMITHSLKFVEFLIKVFEACHGTKRLIAHLENRKRDYQELNQPVVANRNVNNDTRSAGPNIAAHGQQVTYLIPSFRTTDIPSAQLLAKIFNVSDIQLQQDVFKVKQHATKAKLAGDLLLIKDLFSDGRWGLHREDFEVEEEFKYYMESITDKIQENVKTTRSDDAKSPARSSDLMVISWDTRIIFEILLSNVLTYESQVASGQPLVSNQSRNLITLASTYWFISPVTHAVTLLHSANRTILSTFNVAKCKEVYQAVMNIRDQSEAPEFWSKMDEDLFTRDMLLTYSQICKSLKTWFATIFTNQTESLIRIKEIYKIYWMFFDVNAIFQERIYPTEFMMKQTTRLKNALLHASEDKYKSLLDEFVPRDDTLDFHNIEELSANLYATIQALSGKVKSIDPLFNKLPITGTMTNFMIRCFAEDLANMHTHIISCSKETNQDIGHKEALACYQEVCNLRDIYKQINLKTPFPYDLEKQFFPYILMLLRETCSTILPNISNALDEDQITPQNPEAGVQHSQSIIFIFRMLTQYVSMWETYDDLTPVQFAEVYTTLFGSISDGLIWLICRMRDVVLDQVQKYRELTSGKEESKNVWDLETLKTSLLKAKTAEPSKDSEASKVDDYKFTEKCCVALNNIAAIITQFKELEERVDVLAVHGIHKPKQTPLKQEKTIITVRIIKAENIRPCHVERLTSAYIVLTNQSQIRAPSQKTKIVRESLNPVYDEEFEYEVPQGQSLGLVLTVWNQKGSRVSLNQEDICGRCAIEIDTRSIRDDGIPVLCTAKLDTEGLIHYEVVCERERSDDILFAIGKVHRFEERVMRLCLSQIVDEFNPFIMKAISRETLKDLSSTLIKTKEELSLERRKEIITDAIDLLFKYLNVQFDILARSLTPELLYEIMLKSWDVILAQFDRLLLPALASVKVLERLRDKFNLKRNFLVAWASTNNQVYTPGFGNSLSDEEIEYVFLWLDQLLLFFHNDGDGPDLTKLQNQQYRKLILIHQNYSKSGKELMSQIIQAQGEVLQAIRIKNFLPAIEPVSQSQGLLDHNVFTRAARSNTIMSHGRRNTILRRNTRQPNSESSPLPPLPTQCQTHNKIVEEEKEQEHEKDEQSKASFTLLTEDTILRILIAKDVNNFVKDRLSQRDKLVGKVGIERQRWWALKGGRR